MTVTVTTRGRIDLDTKAVLDWLSVQAVGMVQRRSAKGASSDGTPFRKYSDLYAMQLLSVGENDKVDLTRSGAYLASIGERRRHIDPSGRGGYVVIGPDTGTSPSMPLPPPYVFSQDKSPEQRAEAFADWKAAPKKPGRSPPHNVLGALIERGTTRMPARPHLGLTAEERKRLAAQVLRYAIKQGR